MQAKTEVLERMKDLGGAKLHDRMIDLHNQRTRRIYCEMDAAIAAQRWEEALFHCKRLAICVEEIGTLELLPDLEAVETLILDHDAAALVEKLLGLRERMTEVESELTATKS